MNKLLLCGALFAGLSANAQTTLFQDNFQAGTANWTLNGGTGSNQWIANNVYAGFSGFIDDTPSQPGTFTGGVNSTYLHITNNDICGMASICNANFDTGSSSNQSATQTTPIVTTAYSNVTLDFWYLCAGSAGTSYGIVEYSTDGGTMWTAASSQYSGVTTWTNAVITLPAFNNQASLKFRFRWQNGGVGDDPAFSVDEVKITGTSGAGATVSTGAITPTTYCLESLSINVPITVTGTVNAGNVYTVQLSNSSGSFASPTAVGTLASTSTGAINLTANIPNGTPPGTGYRIRVDASNPATTGTDNGANLTFVAKPVISVNSVPANAVICSGSSASLTASGANTYMWAPSGSLSSATGANVTATPTSTQVYTVIGTIPAGCSDTLNFTVTVENCAGLEEASLGDFELYPNPANQEVILNFGELKGIQTVSILDLAGRTVLSTTGTSTTIDVSSLESGKYFLMIGHEAGVSTKSFLKQ